MCTSLILPALPYTVISSVTEQYGDFGGGHGRREHALRCGRGHTGNECLVVLDTKDVALLMSLACCGLFYKQTTGMSEGGRRWGEVTL